VHGLIKAQSIRCLIPLLHEQKASQQEDFSAFGRLSRSRKHMYMRPVPSGIYLAVTPAYPTLLKKPFISVQTLKVMTLGPILLFADKLLIMSMAAIGLQQQLDA